MTQITIPATITPLGVTKDNINWDSEYLNVVYSVANTPDGVQPIVTLLDTTLTMSELTSMLNVMEKVQLLQESLGEIDV